MAEVQAVKSLDTVKLISHLLEEPVASKWLMFGM